MIITPQNILLIILKKNKTIEKIRFVITQTKPIAAKK